MEALTCKRCKQTSSLPPSAQRIRCLGCQTLHSLSATGDAARSTTQEFRLDISKKKTEAKDLCRTLRRKLPFSTTTPPPPPQNTPCASLRGKPRPGRRALVCGVSYRKQKHELKGSALDVRKMSALLLESFHFPQESVLVLTEEDGFLPPTRENIEEGLRWLVRGIRPGDSLVFYFSGHGKRQREEVAGDEIDGFDETICPVDFEANGMIVDNFINRAIVRPLGPGVKLHAIIDSCHSGTILDLPHVCNARGEWEDNSPPSGAYKGTKGGKAICFSACEDYQLAADTTLFSSEREMTGAMTITFINAIKESQERNEKISYKGVMDAMHESIKQAGKSGGIFAGIRRRFHRRILQDPLLSSTEEFNTSTEFSL
ncbi:metacaspase-1-like [Salvia splendens]|uniref:metacaspase-1-like n=1 Tax=Salvia splendens TaxID=180675 RepID=UPI001C257AE6|nr:metacaspase-1-like [Salvia splendens]XP_042011050.1 metacaspase-1-like [Salvia splendens]